MTTTSDDARPDNRDVKDANAQIAATYDSQQYTSNAFPFCSPRHLQAAAHLYHLSAPEPRTARVLELGCAGGGNLLPFALAYPEAQVVGIDLSANQIAQGQAVVKALGVQNLQLHAMSLTDITPEFGQFDYIIAHGVFSWVPPEVRVAMLRIVRENLSPEGVAYISYNTYPGWKAGDIVRDAMLLHSHGITDDTQRLASAKAVLNLLSDGIAAGNPLAPSLRAAVAQLQKHSDYYIAHEYLELFNSPAYLLEFAALAQEQGVLHVGDAEPHVELSVTYGQNVQLHHSLVALGQPRVMRQQYLDFAVGRNFRKSLLVHEARADAIAISPDLSRLADLRWAGHFTEVEADATSTDDRLAFRNHRGQPLHTRETNVIAVLQALTAAWPASLTVAQLATAVQPKLPSTNTVEQTQDAVLSALQTLFRLNSLRYALSEAPYDAPAVDPAQGPRLIDGFASIRQERQNPAFGIGNFNLWHENVQLSLHEAEAWVLPYLDGKHSRKQLATLLRDALSRGDVLHTDGQSRKGQRNLDAVADKIVGRLLELLQRQALLA